MRKCVPKLACLRGFISGLPAFALGLLVCCLLIPLCESPALAERLDLGLQPFAEAEFDLDMLDLFPADPAAADQTTSTGTAVEPGTPEGTAIVQNGQANPATADQTASTATVAEPGTPEGTAIAQNGQANPTAADQTASTATVVEPGTSEGTAIAQNGQANPATADQTASTDTVVEPGTSEGTAIAQNGQANPAAADQTTPTDTVAEPGTSEATAVAQNGQEPVASEPAAVETTGGTDIAFNTDARDLEPTGEADLQETDLDSDAESTDDEPDQEMAAFGELPEPQPPQLLWRFKTLFARNDEAGGPNDTIGEIEKLEERLSHIPLIRTARVERHIQYFRTSKRDHFDQWLVRLNHYRPLVEKIFAQFQLPTDLIFLSLVESGFNPKAYSRARAAGPWQFMKRTGRNYGLRVDSYVDERRDPIKSTVAAARYLRDLYDLFGTWPLAMAAYNAGENKIKRALRKARADTFWEIAKTRYIRRETREYVPRFMAAAIIARNPGEYGFEAGPTDIHEFEEIIVSRPLHLRSIAAATDVSYAELRRLNPELRRDVTPPTDRAYHLKVPVGSGAAVEEALASVKTWTPPRAIAKGKKDRGVRHGWYRVRWGDSLSTIAKRFRVTVEELKDRNDLSGSRIKAGDLLHIGR